ncbi:MAG: HPr(Ser) kinase/phosphatase [Verrucomicrobia bacterium]|nr:HPr(Ser) kinase/phosphatase [Verrucomicrobiota bacterium]
MQRDPVTVEKFFTLHHAHLGLKLVAGAGGLGRRIQEPTVNRPGLLLAGFTKYFASRRIQVFGSAESSFMKTLPPAQREARYAELFSYRIPCLVLCRGINADKLLLRTAEEANVPVLKCPNITMNFINDATLALEGMFAPRSTELGSMVDILGIGVIIRGESGIGKSECVLALIERGYSLVSDDVTRVVLEDGEDVVGSSPELTASHMEVRGIGIINVQQMFGVKSIRTKKKVDLVVSLKQWDEVKDVDRLGLEQQCIKILGRDIPHMVIPVSPGRDVARLVEVAAFYTKMKMFGLNPAQELNETLIARMNPGTKL